MREHEFLMDAHGNYIIPPPQLMPLYGLWNGSRWVVNRFDEVVANADVRVVAALAANNPEQAWIIREIATDGLPVTS